MAFQGYFLKVGNYTIPLQYIKLESYKSAPDQRQDLDSYRDADGYLHRNVLPHTATKIEFETPYMYMKDFEAFLQNIINNFISELEQDCTLTYYNTRKGVYSSGHFYMPGTLEFPMYNKQIYLPARFAFIEY